MGNYRRFFEKGLLLVCALGYVAEFIMPNVYTVVVLGLIGLIYCSICLGILIFNRIKFDWVITNGHFLTKVCNFVLLVPFVSVTITLQPVERIESAGNTVPFADINLVAREAKFFAMELCVRLV